MIRFDLLLSLAAAALLTPAPAQIHDLAGAKAPTADLATQPAADLDDAAADLAFVLLAPSADVVRWLDQDVLHRAVVVVPTKPGRFPVPMPVWGSRHLDADLYIQKVTFDARLARPRFSAVCRASAQDLAWIAAASDLASGTRPRSGSFQLLPPALPIAPELNFRLVASARTDLIERLVASFRAPSTGYGLALVRVEQRRDVNASDVYLYRKLAGPGEARIEEDHLVSVELAQVKMVRVLLAEGAESRPGAAPRFEVIAVLTQ